MQPSIITLRLHLWNPFLGPNFRGHCSKFVLIVRPGTTEMRFLQLDLFCLKDVLVWELNCYSISNVHLFLLRVTSLFLRLAVVKKTHTCIPQTELKVIAVKKSEQNNWTVQNMYDIFGERKMKGEQLCVWKTKLKLIWFSCAQSWNCDYEFVQM